MRKAFGIARFQESQRLVFGRWFLLGKRNVRILRTALQVEWTEAQGECDSANRGVELR